MKLNSSFVSSWKDELKGSLTFDLFAKKRNEGPSIMIDNLTKVFQFSEKGLLCRQIDVSGFIDAVF